jgi:peroxiredoxin
MTGRTWTRVLAGLSAAASLMVVVLTLRVRDLTDEVRHLRFERNLPQVGDVVPALRAPLLGGDSVDLARSALGRRQVWFVFNTTCPICGASLPEWNAAFDQLRPDSTVVILGVSLDSATATRAYAETNAVPFPVAILNDGRDPAMYRIPGVPLTMVFDAMGRIRLVRPGRFTGAGRDSLVSFLSSQQAFVDGVARR